MQNKDKCLYLEIAFYCILFIIAFMTTTTFLQSNLFRPEVKQVDSYEYRHYDYPYSPLKAASNSPVSGASEAYKKRSCRKSYQCTSMATALVYEARSESEIGAVAIAYVILERKENGRWGNTISEVIHAKKRGVCQFSYVCKRQLEKPKDEDWTRAYTISYDVLHNLVANPIGKADHYHTVNVNPKWDNKMQYVATVDNHEFYKE